MKKVHLVFALGDNYKIFFKPLLIALYFYLLYEFMSRNDRQNSYYIIMRFFIEAVGYLMFKFPKAITNDSITS